MWTLGGGLQSIFVWDWIQYRTYQVTGIVFSGRRWKSKQSTTNTSGVRFDVHTSQFEQYDRLVYRFLYFWWRVVSLVSISCLPLYCLYIYLNYFMVMCCRSTNAGVYAHTMCWNLKYLNVPPARIIELFSSIKLTYCRVESFYR